ncbi:MAG: hypothetical protein AWU57_4720, partial [Marinobacter sp. T13-3]
LQGQGLRIRRGPIFKVCAKLLAQLEADFRHKPARALFPVQVRASAFGAGDQVQVVFHSGHAYIKQSPLTLQNRLGILRGAGAVGQVFLL